MRLDEMVQGGVPPERDDPVQADPASPDLGALSDAVALAEEVFWAWDLATDRVSLSDRWHGLLGLPADARTHHWRERVHPDDLARMDVELRALQDGSVDRLALECRMRHGDGSYRWVDVKAVARMDDQGIPTRILGTLLDVTEHRRTQDIFERLVHHNALILNAAGDGIYCLDAHGRATFVNPAAARMLGTNVAELTGAPLCRFREGCGEQDGAVRHAPDCPIEETLRNGLMHRVYDGAFVGADGRGFPVEYVVSPLRRDGVPHGAVVVFEDVTERRWSEEEIRRERRFSDGLIKSSLDGILAFDNEMRITLWNPAMERITGLQADEVLGRDIVETLPFLDAEATGARGLRAILEGKACVAGDRAYDLPATGRSGFYEARYAPLYADDRKIIGGVGIVRDTTQTKQREDEIRAAREKLAKSEKLAALGTLVSGVGHELRTPMSYINNHLYLIKMLGERMKAEDPSMAPVAEEFIRRAQSSMKGIERMSTLLDDLRATYRSDSEVKDMDLKEVVEHALRLFRGAYEGPVSVEADLRPTGPLRLETGRIQQIIINLLNNAAEAMPEGGTIQVETTAHAEGAELVVRDTGTGMSPEVQAEIFHPFYTTKKEGSGLGLYLVKQIVERHMGTIGCSSVEGQGTAFRIFLPRHKPEEDERVLAPAPVRSGPSD